MAVKPGNFKKKTEGLNPFEMKILRQIFGPMRQNRMQRIIYNEELHRGYKDLDIIFCIKFKKLQWAEHAQRLPLDHIGIKAPKTEFTDN
jgi:hypothetical protein